MKGFFRGANALRTSNGLPRLGTVAIFKKLGCYSPGSPGSFLMLFRFNHTLAKCATALCVINRVSTGFLDSSLFAKTCLAG